MRRIYLDHAAATPVSPAVLAAMKPYFCRKYGNPGSLHSFGQEAMAAVDAARAKVAQAIGAEFREVVFTASATEANNTALRGVVKAYQRRSEKIGKNQRPKLLISAVEHESVLETAYDLEKDGAEIVEIPVDRNGVISPKKLEKELDARTVLISVMYVNNEIGSIQPIAEIAEAVKNWKLSAGRRIKNSSGYPLLHTDAAQAPAYLDCDVNKLGVDLMTLSSQKINGPKGVGALYVNSKFKIQNSQLLSPLVTGGGQEHGLRSGTENVPGIVGFATAMDAARRNAAKNFKKVKELQAFFLRELQRAAPDIEVNGEPAAPHILNIYFPKEYAGDLLVKLDIAGVAASSGSACAARAFTPSHVLQALGLPGERIRGSIRFSFGPETTKNELREAVRRITFSLPSPPL
jgi:cysteine desulfurase